MEKKEEKINTTWHCRRSPSCRFFVVSVLNEKKTKKSIENKKHNTKSCYINLCVLYLILNCVCYEREIFSPIVLLLFMQILLLNCHCVWRYLPTLSLSFCVACSCDKCACFIPRVITTFSWISLGESNLFCMRTLFKCFKCQLPNLLQLLKQQQKFGML